jgi:phage protein D
MTNLTSLTTSQLHRIIAIKEQIEALQGQIDSIAGGGGQIPSLSAVESTKKHRRSAAVRARMAAAQQARWARVKGETATPKAAKKRDRRSSPAVRAKLAAAARARWARVRAEGKTTL